LNARDVRAHATRRQTPVPVTTGSASFRTIDTGSSVVTHARFPANSVIAPHTHDRPIFAVMLSGGFQSDIAHRRLECTRATLWTEPAGEMHANFIGRGGAHVIVVQPDPALAEAFAPFASLLENVRYARQQLVASDATRIASEIEDPDALTPMAIDAFIFSMLTTASRSTATRRRSAPPPWLTRVNDLLHEHFRERIALAELAAVAGVHPSHLAREFRAHHGESIGDHVRRLRCEWAAARLLTTTESISEIAASAGYSDQSHFTRHCVRLFGIGPGRYRRTRGAKESWSGSFASCGV
jgi:AraC family transcriptional regulator